MPSAFHDAARKASPRNGGATGAWTKGPDRFAKEIPVDKLTPSAVHYTPNYSQVS